MAATAALSTPVAQPQTSRKKVADILVDYLDQLGVEYVFGIPGGAIEPLYNALARSKRQGGPRPIVARHETGAAFMADGYFRETGKLGVCCATTGPGTTNLITGVASAYANEIPMLVITAQSSLYLFGRGAFQESSCTGINTVALFQSCCRYTTLVSHIEQLENKLIYGLMSALGTPAGPVHLSIPRDILSSPAPVDKPSYQIAALTRRASLFDSAGADELCREIENAHKVVFVVGDGCGDAIGAVVETASLINAAIVATPHGKGLMDPYHPLFRGIIGFAGHETATETLSDPGVDAIVAIGTNLSEWASNGWDRVALLNERLIHVDPVEGHFARSPMAKLHVRGRIRTLFNYVLNDLQTRHTAAPRLRSIQAGPGIRAVDRSSGTHPSLPFRLAEETKYADDSTPIKPQRLMRELAEIFPENTCFLADTGNSQAWSIHYLHPRTQSPGNSSASSDRYRACLEFVSMGWAIGAAIGIAVGSRGRPVVCITGDGSLLMSGQEITVAIQERLPVIFVVLNDSALGMVKHGQRLNGAEPIAFELPKVDFCAYAKSMGVDGYIIRSPQDLRELDIDALCKRQGPSLLDVRVDPEEVPPMSLRLRIFRKDP